MSKIIIILIIIYTSIFFYLFTRDPLILHSENEIEEKLEPLLIKEKTIYDEYAEIIHILESGGKHNLTRCEKDGKVNMIGYDVKNKCFDSHEEELSFLAEKLKDRLAKNSEPFVICSYNLGPNSEHLENCMKNKNGYYNKFLKLKSSS